MTPLSRVGDALRAPNEPHSARIVADAYWSALIVASTLVIACSFWYGYSEFESVSSAGAAVASARPAYTNSDRAKIEAVAAGLSARADAYNAIKTQSASTSDPLR